MLDKIHSPALNGITITDALFSHYVSIVSGKLIPYQWRVLNDCEPQAEKSYCVANFRVAAGDIPGKHEGMVFSDTDAYKWIETLAYCLERGEGCSFESHAEELIDLIGRAQEPDGYLNTYFSVNCPDKKWTNFAEGHELYTAGHLIEAAVAYFRATGRSHLLEIASRFADLICDKFSVGCELGDACPGHQEIELALVKLADCTGRRKYAELARHFLEVRGNDSDFLRWNLQRQGRDRIFSEFADYDGLYAQSHLPPVQQETAEGHAVRAMYMYSAMADIAREFDDGRMVESCVRLWKNLTKKRMYITGGIGSSGYLERFTTDYDLPNDRMYCESCASVGLMMYGQRMAALTGEAFYYDAVERALCNTVIAGIAAEGNRYFYVNPLEVWPENCLPGTSMAHVKPVRQPWFACACCPANIARTLASVGQYIYAQNATSIFVNQLISSNLHTEIGNSSVSLKLTADLLTLGRLSLTVRSDLASPFTVRLRIPPWLEDPVFFHDSREISPVREKGYALLEITDPGESTFEIRCRVTPRWIAANRNVRADAGKVSLMFGPFVYCLEEADNGSGLPFFYVDPAEATALDKPADNLPGELPMISFRAKRLDSGVGDELYGAPSFTFSEKELKAIPYALWCNRTPGEMQVWLNAAF